MHHLMTQIDDIRLDARDGGFIAFIAKLGDTAVPVKADTLNRAVEAAGLALSNKERIKPSRPETFVTLTCSAIANRITRKGGKGRADVLTGKGATLKTAWRQVEAGLLNDDATGRTWHQVLRGCIVKPSEIRRGSTQEALIAKYQIPVLSGVLPFFMSPLGTTRGDELVEAAYETYRDHIGMVTPTQVREWLFGMLTSGSIEGAAPALELSVSVPLYIPESLRQAYELLEGVVEREVGFRFEDTRAMIQRSLIEECEVLAQEIQDACIRPSKADDPEGWEKWEQPSTRKINALKRKIKAKLQKLDQYRSEQQMDVQDAVRVINAGQNALDTVDLVG